MFRRVTLLRKEATRLEARKEQKQDGNEENEYYYHTEKKKKENEMCTEWRGSQNSRNGTSENNKIHNK